MSIREFLGFGGYQRPVEGYLSWQHLTFVTALVVLMAVCAVALGRKYKNKSVAQKNRVLAVTAFLIDGVELFKILILCLRYEDPWYWRFVLPLFLCSIQLIAIPLAAFSQGRLKEAALDFIVIFGLLGAILGTYFAGNNYGAYPVLSLDNVSSGITHTMAGFASLYILFCGLCSMQKKNIPVTAAILGVFCVLAYLANLLWDCNYMFLSQGDGTPYDLVYNFVNGNPVLYPLCVVGLFVVYIALYYHIYFAVQKKRGKVTIA
jgi:uncharacterized membrane protein YwaF